MRPMDPELLNEQCESVKRACKDEDYYVLPRLFLNAAEQAGWIKNTVRARDEAVEEVFVFWAKSVSLPNELHDSVLRGAHFARMPWDEKIKYKLATPFEGL